LRSSVADFSDSGDSGQSQEETEMIRNFRICAGDRLARDQVLGFQVNAVLFDVSDLGTD